MSTQGERMYRRTRNFGSNVGLNVDLIRGKVKAWGAVHTVGIEQRHGGHSEVLAHAYKFLGQGRAFEEAEGRAGVKFNVH